MNTVEARRSLAGAVLVSTRASRRHNGAVRYELWESEDGELTLSPEGVPPPAPLDADATPLHVFEADTWERAMAQYHDHMGWGPYRPV